MNDNPRPDPKQVFFDALELPAERRGEFLNRACGGDEPLRERVEKLLAAFDDAGTFLASPTHSEAEPSDSPGTTARSGSTGAPSGSAGSTAARAAWTTGSTAPEPIGALGAYVLLRRLGEGAYGEVFHAEQTEPVRRSVALKVLKLGLDSRQVLSRFGAERQLLATLDHPNIARFLDAGTTEDGRPFFVMDLVRGTRITEHCDGNRASIRERVELLIGACRGVQHAHEMGVVHRDLKPGNILVEVRDDRAMARVIDFGIAKALAADDATEYTRAGQMLGTPAYMSPEQASGGGNADARSDVWSLGCVLYELLVGVTPIAREDLRRAEMAEVSRMIREREIPTPSDRIAAMGDSARSIARHRAVESSRLSSLLRGELDCIACMALARDRGHRYESAGALADDLQRWLDGRPVAARPRRSGAPWSTAGRVLRKHSRRARIGAAVAAPMLLLGLWLAGSLPFAPGLSEMMQRSVETYASGQRYGLPEGAWVNGMKVNRVGGVYALVGGGQENAASRDFATIGGGSHNTASGRYAMVGGGVRNLADGDFATVAGGNSNRAAGHKSVIGGGNFNMISDFSCTIAGGERNEARSFAAGVGGGFNNVADGPYSTVAGGRANRAYAAQSFVGGGHGNRVGDSGADRTLSDGSSVGGGINNTATAKQSVVAGGYDNSTSASYAAIGGGVRNQASGLGATVAGGSYNTASGESATIGGGLKNEAAGYLAAVPGGTRNVAAGRASFAAGSGARAIHDGSFVWSDSVDVDTQDGGPTLDSGGARSFTARARGGFRLFTAPGTAAVLRPGEGSWSHDLSSDLRTDAHEADADAVLAGLARLRVENFRYAGQAGDVRHLGPSGPEFHRAFGLGVGDGHVNGGDLHGVALVAIRALLARVNDLEAAVREQRSLLLEQAALLESLAHGAATK